MKKLLISITALALVLNMTGCGAEPEIPAEEMVATGLMNLYNVSSGSYDFELVTEMTYGGVNVDFEMMASGILDITDYINPVYTADLELKGSDENGEEIDLKGEVRVDKDMIYFMVKNLQLSQMPMTDAVESLLNKWWKVEVPEEGVTTLNMPFGAKENLPDELKALRELFENATFFKNYEYLGTKGGSYGYKVYIDEEGYAAFLTEKAKLNGLEVDEEGMNFLKENIKTAAVPIEIWVDQDAMTVSKIAGAFTVPVEDADGVAEDAVYDMILEIRDFNESVKLDVPKDADEFDPMMLIGLMMMMGGADLGGEVALPSGDDVALPVEDDVVVEGDVPVEDDVVVEGDVPVE